MSSFAQREPEQPRGGVARAGGVEPRESGAPALPPALEKAVYKTYRGPVLRRFLPGCLFFMVIPLLLQAASIIRRGSYLVAALPLGYAALILLVLFFSRVPGICSLARDVALPPRPGEAADRHYRRIGRACLFVGLLLTAATFFGLPWLYRHGLERGSQPLLEVVLMVPSPLIGITLTFWGLGKIIKDAPDKDESEKVPHQ